MSTTMQMITCKWLCISGDVKLLQYTYIYIYIYIFYPRIPRTFTQGWRQEGDEPEVHYVHMHENKCERHALCTITTDNTAASSVLSDNARKLDCKRVRP